MDNTNQIPHEDILVAQNKKEKEESERFKKRRYEQWNENYALYRDNPTINRLTQRQSVNLPIVRETIQTWISKTDEPPLLTFEARGKENADKQGEIIVNEIWATHFEKLKLDLVDNLDKKVVGLQGRSFKKLGWRNGCLFIDVVDPFDIDIDPRVHPFDINTAHHLIHKHIFRPLRDILAYPKFSIEGKNKLKMYLQTREGILKAATDHEEYQRKMDRLMSLGAHNFDDFRASDVMVQLNESYKLIWVEAEKKFVRHLLVIAADHAVLYCKPLKAAIGINYLPYSTWADDPDLNDFWCDGKADSVRTVNKIANAYISQDLESRTYRNFGMYFYNTLNGTFIPKAFEPRPFGMYGVPGNPDEVVKQIDIQPLSDTPQQIQFLKDLIQSSVAQTPTERGEQEDGDTTLGEVQLTLKQSQTRQQTGAKQYRRAWEDTGRIFYGLLESNASGAMTLYKKGNDGNYYSKDVYPSEWRIPKGYEVKVTMKAEKDSADDMDLKKVQYVKSSFANNPAAIRIAKKKELELLKWTPEEIEEVMQAEEQAANALATSGMAPNPQETELAEPAADPNNPQMT